MTDPTPTAPSLSMGDPADGGMCGAVGSPVATLSVGLDQTSHPNGGQVALFDAGPGAGALAKADIDGAIVRWNDLLLQGKELPGMFWFVRSSGGIPINFDAGGGDSWCGTVGQGSGGTVGPVTIKHGSNCNNDRRAPRQDIVTHELAHVAGWNQGHGPKFAKEGPLTAGLCTTFLPLDTTAFPAVPGSVCHHEVEPIFRGRMAGGWPIDSLLLSQPIVVGVTTTPLTLTGLVAGDTANLTVTHWRHMPGFGQISRGNSSVLWSSVNTSVATIAGIGKVRGVAAGTTKIRLRGQQSSVPSGFQLWRPFRDIGDSVAVTVVAPPPITPQILLDEVPIHTPGWHTLTFVGPGSPGPLTWAIDDSRTTTINPDAVHHTPGWSLGVYVEAGSYTLRVTAGGVTQDFPVCTAGGGGSLDGRTAGGGTEAVEGCPPPEAE